MNVISSKRPVFLSRADKRRILLKQFIFVTVQVAAAFAAVGYLGWFLSMKVQGVL